MSNPNIPQAPSGTPPLDPNKGDPKDLTGQEKGSEGEQKDSVSQFKEATDKVIGSIKEAVGGASKEKDEESKSSSKEESQQPSKSTHADPADLSASQQKSSKLAANLSMAGAPVFVESDNVIDLIVDDHRNARELYENYKHTDARNAKKTIVKELIKTLVAHDECEQLLVYPLLKEKIGGSEEATRLYEKSLGEHQEHRELLYEVYNLDINKEFEKLDSKLKQAMESVVHHVTEEERDVLPLIQKHLTEEELKKVGASFRAHKPFSVTRPHPSAPQTGFPAALGNMTLKPFDALKDFIEG